MSLLYTLGRSIGDFRRGITDAFHLAGNHPSLRDESAWVHSTTWGEALGKGHKPRTKQEYIANYLGWVYACVKLNANGVASIPLRLYVAKQKRGKAFETVTTRAISRRRYKWLSSNAALDRFLSKADEVDEVTEHAFLDLMTNVNRYHNSRDLKYMTSMFGDLTGESYWYLIRDDEGRPRQIFVMPSQFVNPIYGKSLDKAIAGYLYKQGNTEIVLKEDEVLMIADPSPHNIFAGFSCVQGTSDAVYIQSQMNAFEEALFENRARPGGMLETTEPIDQASRRRMEETFKQKFKGSQKAGKTLALPRGMKFTRDSMTPEELSYIEGRKLNREEICAGLDVPHALFNPNSNRANSENAEIIHAKYGILPRCRRIEQKINERLLPMYGNEENMLFCVFDDPVPENRELLLEERSKHVSIGIITRDEARAQIGEDPRGGNADELLVDNRLIPIDEAEKQEPPSFAPGGGGGNEDEDEDEEAERMALRAKDKLRDLLDAHSS